MHQDEIKYLMKLHGHKLSWCPTCRNYMIVCGNCGLNQCSCGRDCDMCDEAYEIMNAFKYPFYCRLRERLCRKIDYVKLKVSNTIYYIEEGWKKWKNH